MALLLHHAPLCPWLTSLLLAASLLVASLAAAGDRGRARAGKPIPLVFAESIGGVKPGMTRAQVEAAGHALKPEGIERGTRVGYLSGPLLFLFDEQGHVVLISVELARSPGLKVGKKLIRRDATLKSLMGVLANCSLERGSAGNALSCRDEKGRTLEAYDSFEGPQVWVHLGPG